MDLKNKIAVVTGASSGLGLQFSRSLVERGMHVFGLARSEDKLENLARELGDRFTAVRCDIRLEDVVDAAFARVENEAGRIDVLVNNAGLGHRGNVVDTTADTWDTLIETNTRGVFLCARRAVPVMARQNEESGFGGHIVNIASIAGLLGNPTLAAYNASKFAVRGFSEALMKEVRADGIKVTCMYPGSIETNFSQTSGQHISSNAMTAQDIASTLLHVLETDDNYLISELVMRPLRP